ncbi:ATP-binding cassette domain-containing protein [Hymenobacter taeanensis]|uniref:ATP-binding cassette domain-containing protein n=1 Tax=Hymenobacter taeanensis TaxID=2735321 RepID=A0A6M6BMK1_9BACT|nr:MULTISPECIES: ABC transporter ATP-binding protein [Hymenobacter]QJX49058.1 ATP-binding cassette domain-containing protein [Hymenobacter taeanensis]UOQ81421.1 ABC transporter ATP-binding protein [Hymenobacter sp. 5414T-23]
MSDVVIKAEGLSKVYRLGTTGTGSLRQDLQHWWTTSILKKEDPFFQAPSADNHRYGQNQLFRALHDVNFEIKQGEVWGVIGSNGSGKSTLLKIISRIVRPTSGTVRGKGTISSLLEVGTGFNPELTGRENVYLSGFILGMNKHEIRQKFDEIVAFSGLERFLDTPVKRYSSGMYVRLAFAVAAHLEPDILILDEVLAVGDAEFQKKCLGKIREVSHTDGRTVIFVSHNMQAVANLCQQALWLNQGLVQEQGEVSRIVNKFLLATQQNVTKQYWGDTPAKAPGNEFVRFQSVELIPHFFTENMPLDVRVPLTVRFQMRNLVDKALLNVHLGLYNSNGDCVLTIPSAATVYREGILAGECTIPGNLLNDGAYCISLFVLAGTAPVFDLDSCLTFELEDYRGDESGWKGKWWGTVRPLIPFPVALQEPVLH